jgi:SAM-dependent methyltransferase
MTTIANPVVSGYSDLAAAYDAPANLRSCWGISTNEIVDSLELRPRYEKVADIGCGTGQALAALAGRASAGVELYGIEPAAQMRERAAVRTSHFPNVRTRGQLREHPARVRVHRLSLQHLRIPLGDRSSAGS